MRAGSTPSFTKSAHGICAFCGVATHTAAFGALTAGQAIAGFVVWNSNSITLSSVADGCGNTLTLGTSANNGSWTIQPVYKTIISGGASCTLTVTLSGTATKVYSAFHEVTNVSAYDTWASAFSGYHAAGSYSVNSGAVTTTAANDYLMLAVIDVNCDGSNGPGLFAPSGYTGRVVDDSQNLSWQSADGTKATAGAVTPSWTVTTSTNAVLATLAMKN